MIKTRFGSEVEILAYDATTGAVNIKRVDDGKIFQTWISELRADGGGLELREVCQHTPGIERYGS